jgi:hypothetical protein
MSVRIMRQSLFFLLPLVGLLVTSSGCTQEGFCSEPVGAHAYAGPPRAFRGSAHVAAGLLDAVLLGAEIADAVGPTTSGPEREWTTDDGEPSDNDGDAQRLLGPQTFHTVPPAPPPRESRAFDLGGAYGQIAQVDVGECKADGLAPGYGRVLLGFGTDGAPVDVGVEIPAGSTQASRACLENAFRKIRVAPFDGATANVRRAFYVKA